MLYTPEEMRAKSFVPGSGNLYSLWRYRQLLCDSPVKGLYTLLKERKDERTRARKFKTDRERVASR